MAIIITQLALDLQRSPTASSGNMSGRPIISYDDITLPYDPQPEASDHSQPPPAKKFRTNGNKNNSQGNHQQHNGNAHRDRSMSQNYPSSSSTGHPGQGKSKKGGKGKGKNDAGKSVGSESVESNRDLTHEEIWDDSALVDAWDAAMEEYRALNGPDKSWQQDPVHKSSLWYNTPKTQDPDASMQDAEDDTYGDDGDAENYGGDEDLVFEEAPQGAMASTSQSAQQYQIPYNFDPTSAAADLASAALPSTVSQDEAFSRALNAMYWGGYYTAIYHSHRAQAMQATPASQGEAQDEADTKGEQNE